MMHMAYKLGSLFDGSGGFPLAGSLCGVEPVWASEVEPYPIAVTRSRFPNMHHLGDISKVNGGEIEPVDIITFGSPCQDLSVAGKRAGLKHEANGDEETTRSGLFMEAVRIIKEMREATNGEYPTFALWENVPGAFSSNRGEDFRTVLEELIKIVEPAVMPAVPKNGWPYADSYCGDGWSLAYRVFDAQYWGVPQRRRRIYLVLDLRGQRAGKVSFEREGLRGNFETFKTAGQGTSGDATNRTGADDCEGAIPINTMIATRHRQLGRGTGFGVGEAGDPQFTISAGHEHAVAYTLKICDENILDDQGGQQITVRTDGKAPTLRAETHGNLPCVLEAAGFKAGQSMAGGIGWQKECAATLAAQCSGAEPTVCVKKAYSIENHPADSRVDIDDSGKVQTLTSRMGTGGGNVPMVMEMRGFTMQAFGSYKDCGVGSGLKARDYKDATDLVVESAGIDCRNFTEYPELYPTLQAKPNGGQSLNFSGAVRVQYIVRRLTPTECARLQGFPDAWGHPDHKEDFTDEEYRFWLNVRNTHAAINGKAVKDYTEEQMLNWYNKLHTDSAEYKMWGNGIALPPALYCMQGIVDALGREEIMNIEEIVASLRQTESRSKRKLLDEAADAIEELAKASIVKRIPCEVDPRKEYVELDVIRLVCEEGQIVGWYRPGDGMVIDANAPTESRKRILLQWTWGAERRC